MQIDLSDKKRIHFVGIGGSGMSGIAEVLLTHGHDISGSDASQNDLTTRLAKLGATIYHGHAGDQIDSAQIVVLSSAITDDNPEVVAAREKNLIIIPRAQMLASLMRKYYGVAIAGTHGKTTTTSIAASVLAEGGLDPTFVIGGLLKSAGCNAQLGTSQYFVAEADESDASFLLLDPKVAVVTNIDADHLTTYENDFAKLKAAFVTFLNRLPDDGFAVLCIDDKEVRAILPELTCNIITYGFDSTADYVASDSQPDGIQTHFTVSDNRHHKQWRTTLNLPGRHNVQNTLAAIAIAREFGMQKDEINAALKEFAGVGRRLQMHGEFETPNGSVALIEDYGHHPRELAATLSAMRDMWPERRVVMVFQPHRYTRTHELWNDFVEVLAQPDRVVLLDVYTANESPIDGVNSQTLYQEVAARNTNSISYVADVDQLTEVLHQDLQNGDVVLMQGAGSVGRLASQLAEQKLL